MICSIPAQQCRDRKEPQPIGSVGKKLQNYSNQINSDQKHTTNNYFLEFISTTTFSMNMIR